MKIIVAGQDRTGGLGRELGRQAAVMERGGPGRRPPAAADMIPLPRAQSEAEYLEKLIALIRARNAVVTHDFAVPRRSGIAGACQAAFKALLWKILRYQHDRIAFQQNLINIHLTGALEFESVQRRKEAADLQRRVAELEKQSGNCKA